MPTNLGILYLLIKVCNVCVYANIEYLANTVILFLLDDHLFLKNKHKPTVPYSKRKTLNNILCISTTVVSGIKAEVEYGNLLEELFLLADGLSLQMWTLQSSI